MNEELKLLPCPFCGSEGNVDWYTAINYKGEIEYYITCHICCCTNFEASLEKAVSKWNTRHYPPEVQQAVERTKPKKVIRHPWSDSSQGFLALHCDYSCPVCNGELEDMVDFCLHEGCGQALDWS